MAIQQGHGGQHLTPNRTSPTRAVIVSASWAHLKNSVPFFQVPGCLQSPLRWVGGWSGSRICSCILIFIFITFTLNVNIGFGQKG